MATAMERAIDDGFRFGRFTLDLRSRELLKDGIRLRIQDQPYDVLLMLLNSAGDLVTREELRQQLWPNGTFVDFEHGLNAAVKRLRAAIGDSAERPKFIETLARRGYRFIAAVEPIGVQASRLPARRAALPRLAVIPFASVGEERTSAFSEGLSEELTTALGRWFANRVGILATTSAGRAARANPKAVREIGRTLTADFILEGAVRQDGERVRVTARLVETATETQLWACAYERSLSDWFAVQSEVATEIARSLAVELLAPPAASYQAGTRNAAAHQAYLKGRYHWNLPGPDGLAQAIEHYDTAIALDPGFSAAHSSLARAWSSMADYYLAPPKHALVQAAAAAERALAIDDADAEAHIALGDVRCGLERDWPGAEREYRLAFACNPSHEAAYRKHGLLLAAQGRRDEAADSLARACELDPLCLVVHTSAAWVCYLGGDCRRAIEHCEHVLGMHSRFLPAHSVRAAALLTLGRGADAIDMLDAIPVEEHDAMSSAWLAYALAREGRQDRARGLVAQLGVPGSAAYTSFYHLAIAHVGIGDHDRGVEYIRRALDEHDPFIMYVAVEPRLQPLHADERFKSLVETLGVL
jgi:TolB-like protein/Tfp pilus assembly protein PilF